MRSEQELKQALTILGASFVRDVRHYVWGSHEQEGGRAWAMFCALGWMEGSDDSDFYETLQFIAMKINEYAQKERENGNAA